MTAKDDDTFDKVMKGLKGTRGESSADRAEKDKRLVKGRDQAANDRARRNNKTKALNKKDEREYQKRWKNRGGDVTDTGMFSS
jgi:hypothetical protein